MNPKTANLVAMTPGGDVTDDMLAGFYMWFSISEDMLSLARVRKAFKDAGLDPEWLPKERRPEHVAQEAVRRVERITQNGHREEIRVEHPARYDDVIVMQVTKHVQDKAAKLYEHPKALRVTFRFEDSSLGFEALDGSSTKDVQDLIDEIEERFQKNSTKIPGRKLRTVMRHYLEAAGAQLMSSSGAVYFLPKSNPISTHSKLFDHHGSAVDGSDLLQAFSAMLADVYSNPEYHIVPCVNDEGQRAFLKRKFIENCSEEVKALRDECLEVVGNKDQRKRGIRSDLRERLVNRRADLDARRAQYAAILGETLEELDRDMGLADKALVKFITEADSDE